MTEPGELRQQILELFSFIGDLEQPEALIFPVLHDAVLIVEVYRRARHQVTHLPELTHSVDALLRELDIVRKTREWEGSAEEQLQ